MNDVFTITKEVINLNKMLIIRINIDVLERAGIKLSISMQYDKYWERIFNMLAEKSSTAPTQPWFMKLHVHIWTLIRQGAIPNLDTLNFTALNVKNVMWNCPYGQMRWKMKAPIWNSRSFLEVQSKKYSYLESFLCLTFMCVYVCSCGLRLVVSIWMERASAFSFLPRWPILMKFGEHGSDL